MTFEQFWMQNWRTLSDRLRSLYPQLTDEDLSYEVGKEDQLMTRLQGRLGLTKHQIEELMMNESRPKDSYDVTGNAFRGMPENDPDKGGFTGTYKSSNEEQRKMPPTHAPRSEGYDNGITDSGSDTDERR